MLSSGSSASALFVGPLGRAYLVLTFVSFALMGVLVTAFALAVGLESEVWIGATQFILVLYLLLAIARFVVGRIAARRRRSVP